LTAENSPGLQPWVSRRKRIEPLGGDRKFFFPSGLNQFCLMNPQRYNAGLFSVA
jgi:hypothetical protein